MFKIVSIILYALLYGRWKKIGRGLMWTAISDLMEKINKPPPKKNLSEKRQSQGRKLKSGPYRYDSGLV